MQKITFSRGTTRTSVIATKQNDLHHVGHRSPVGPLFELRRCCSVGQDGTLVVIEDVFAKGRRPEQKRIHDQIRHLQEIKTKERRNVKGEVLSAMNLLHVPYPFYLSLPLQLQSYYTSL